MGKFNFNMKISVMDVTPVMAAKWLERNPGNRKVNQSRVRALAKDIKDGHWDCTHQGIAIAADGTLVDGQHRLMAIVMANQTVRMPVALNAPKSAHIDSGSARSLSDRIQMGAEGLTWVNRNIAASVRILATLYPALQLKNEENMRDWLNTYQREIEGAMSCIKNVRIPNMNSSGIAAGFIVAAINGVPDQCLKDFADVMYSSFAHNPEDVYPIALRDEISKYKRNPASGSLQRYAYRRTCGRINQFYCTKTGQKVSRRLSEENFPYNVPDAYGNILYLKGKLVK